MTRIFAIAAAALAAAPALAAAQGNAGNAPGQQTYYACVVPGSGTMYRIKDAGLPPACATGHTEISWTDGARTSDPTAQPSAGGGTASGSAGGDLAGTYPNPIVAKLQGRAISTTAPATGQLLGWNGTAWAPTAAPSAPGDGLSLPYATSVNGGTTDLFSLTQYGTGRAASFSSLYGPGLYVRGSAGQALHAYMSVNGGNSAPAIKAEHAAAAGTALEITRGAIRVAGAGLDTPTPAFWTTLGCGAKYLESPYSNGNPNAIILVTPRSINGASFPAAYVEYDGAVGKWMLKTNSGACGGSYNIQYMYNVLIIRP
jgi:hypothetical protein